MNFIKLTEIERKRERRDTKGEDGVVRSEWVEVTPVRTSVFVNMDRALTIGIGRTGDTLILFSEDENSSCAVLVTESPEEIMARIK